MYLISAIAAQLSALVKSRDAGSSRAPQTRLRGVALCGANGFDGGHLPSGSRNPAGPALHHYRVWIEGRLDAARARALTGVPARSMDRCTVFVADLRPAALYDLLDRLASIGAVILGVGRDHALVTVWPGGGPGRLRYEVCLAGRLDPTLFDAYPVAVHLDGAHQTRVVGRLDHSALHGLLRLVRSHDVELLALRSRP